MAQENSSDDDEWMPDCPICKSVGSTCETHCINLVSEICNNATELSENDGEDTSNLNVTEKIMRLVQQLNEDGTHQQLRQHDLTGVCANVTTVLPQANEQEPDDLAGNNPPQDDQLEDMNVPGIEELIAQMQINAGGEPSELLQSLIGQFTIDDNDFRNNVERAIYFINASHCVYNRAKWSHPKSEVLNRMNYVRQFIQNHIDLDIPENITTILYKIFSSSKKDDDVDNADTFHQLGDHFGRAYRILTGENMDEENDNNNDEADDNLDDGNSDIVDNDDNNYYSDAEDTSGEEWGGDDEDWVDGEAEEEEVENERRRVRRRQN